MAEKETPSGFIDDESEEPEIDYEYRIRLFKDGTVDIESTENIEGTNEAKVYQSLHELISWIQAKRNAEAIMALSIPEEEPNSKLS